MLCFNFYTVYDIHTYAQFALIIEFIVENNVYPKLDIRICITGKSTRNMLSIV